MNNNTKSRIEIDKELSKGNNLRNIESILQNSNFNPSFLFYVPNDYKNTDIISHQHYPIVFEQMYRASIQGLPFFGADTPSPPEIGYDRDETKSKSLQF